MNDGQVIDALVRLFAECRELGITVPDDMPLDTPGHRRAAVVWLSQAVYHSKRYPQGGAGWGI